MLKKALEEENDLQLHLTQLSSQVVISNSWSYSIVIKPFVLYFIMEFNSKCTYCVFTGCWTLCYASNS